MSKLSDPHFKSMHVYFAFLAEALNDAGYDFKKFLEVANYRVDVPFNPDLVKDQLWRPYQMAMTISDKNPHGIISTTEITPGQALKIYETVNKRMGELTGVHVPWPCEENRHE